MASVLWTNVRGTNTKLCAARVYRRSSNADALGDHPRHRTHYWYQCPGRVPQALVPMSGPGQACPNIFHTRRDPTLIVRNAGVIIKILHISTNYTIADFRYPNCYCKLSPIQDFALKST